MKMISLREKHQVVERKDGAIYKTVRLGEEWIDSSIPLYKENNEGIFYSSISTKRMKELNFKDCKFVKD